MTKSNCTFAEQKQNVVEFLKQYKHMLCVGKKRTNLSEKHITKVVNAKNYDSLFEAVCDVRLKVGTLHYFLFSNNPDERHKALSLYMPVCIDNMIDDDKIDEFIEHKTVADLIKLEHCEFFNITPRRWKNFVKMFEYVEGTYVRVEDNLAYLNINDIVKQYEAVCSAITNDKSQIDNVIVAYEECGKLLQKTANDLRNAKTQGAVKVVSELA